MKILHIHQDYPDGRAYPNTKAVSNLIQAVEELDPSIKHFVLSINRTSNPFKVSIAKFDQGLSLVYWALPLPLIYKPAIWFWAFIISFVLKGREFDIIHGHKLTTEGLLSLYLSRLTKIPYTVSVRGGSDCHNIARLSDCKASFREVFKCAQKVFWVSPWAQVSIEKNLNYRHSSNVIISNICQIDGIEPIKSQSKIKYATILSFHQFRRKGLFPLLSAIKSLKANGLHISLDIIGGGTEKYKKIINEEIIRLGLENQLTMLGQLGHSELLARLKRSKALLLPAMNETFGMAYVEALACGCPILFMKNTGIDGHLDDVIPGVRIDQQSAEDIAEAILGLEKSYGIYHQSVMNISREKYLIKFTGTYVAANYVKELSKCLTD